MPTYECSCGARYRFSLASVGKKSKCKRCGAVFVLADEDEGPIRLSDVDGAGGDDLGAGERSTSPHPIPGGAVAHVDEPVPRAPHDRHSVSPPLVDAQDPSRGSREGVLGTLLFPSAPQNLIPFLAVWFILVVGGLIPFFFVPIVLGMWYAGFRFAVIESAAAGESHLPDVELSGDFAYEMLAASVKWLGSWIVALLPAIVYIFSEAIQGSRDVAGLFVTLSGGLRGLLPGSGADPVLVALVAVGMLLWPMLVLVITLGGFESLYSVDRMAITIFRSSSAYGVTLLLVGGSTAANILLSGLVQQSFSGGTPSGWLAFIGNMIVGRALVTGVDLYCEIVMLRVIGLYYHHFKHRFAWDWG